MNVKAVIYDMDGILIDSEPLWRKAEIETFHGLGMHSFTEEMCLETMGMRTSEVIAYWYNRIPWKGKTQEEVVKQLLERVTHLIIEEGIPMKGVDHSLEYFKKKGLRLALASSSGMDLIGAVLKKLGIQDSFEVISSAEYLKFGKPHPEVFLKTSEKLGVQPDECLVIEDSFNGVLAAKAARMKVVAIPDLEHKNDVRFVIADRVLENLNEVDKLGID